MSTNQYAAIDYRINSCLVSGNSYRVHSSADAFGGSALEEISDAERQSVGRCYMEASLNQSRDKLWMVPFHMNETRLYKLLDTIEYCMPRYYGNPGFVFPLDVVSQDAVRAYVLQPIKRQMTQPIRTFMPNVQGPRWQIALNLFRRVAQMRQMGITSNGISREQMRVVPDSNDVTIWFNETLSMLEGSENPEQVSRHMGFLAVPLTTEQNCRKLDLTLSGDMRDLFSAAVAAFYLLMHSHPFVGSAFYGLLHDDYLNYYHNWPRYILEPGTDNHVGNQMIGRAIMDQWDRTTPGLKALFDGIFLAVTHPDSMWDSNADYWDPDAWIEALELDAKENDNEKSRGEYHFENEMYHLV